MTPKVVNCRLVQEPYYMSPENVRINTPDHAIAYFGRDLATYPQEAIEILYMNSQNRPIYMSIVAKGNHNASIVPVADILRIAILANAPHIFMMHNHPSGDITPSDDDLAAYNGLKEACRMVGYSCVDSLVVGAGNNCYYSMLLGEERRFVPREDYTLKEPRSDYLNDFILDLEETPQKRGKSL